MNVKRLLFFAAILSISLLCVECAKTGYPTGGPKDTTPPVPGEAQPPSGSLNFGAKEFYIPFDEYVNVKDADNNILVSPPMKRKPEYTTKGRGLLVKIKDTLQPNTTYIFQFQGAIVDLNEGNPLEHYEYAFSTGSVLDSMMLEGSVNDALSLKPRENPVTVMLYAADAPDSAAANSQPCYITRSTKTGTFKFNNIRPGDYRILALEDGNRDNRLTPGEAVAFCDTLVRSIWHAPDTAKGADTTAAEEKQQGSALDRRAAPPKIEKRKLACELLMSEKKVEKQRVSKSSFLRKGRIEVVMQSPLKDFSIDVAKCDSCTLNDEYLTVRLNKKRDTLSIWTRREECDSIVLVLNTEDKADTLRLKYNARRRKAPLQPRTHLALVRNLNGQQMPYFDTLRFGFENPLRSRGITDSVVSIMNLKDSTVQHLPIVLDSLGLSGYVPYALTQGVKLEMKIAMDALVDIYGLKNDSVTFNTEVTTAAQYGKLVITPLPKEPLPGGRYLIQLLNEKQEPVQQKASVGGDRVVFDHLAPAKYTLRAIFDGNDNGQWDPGDYWEHQQPERVVYFEKTLDVRANWDIEEKFNIE